MAPTDPDRKALDFEGDPRASRSTWAAAVILLAVLAWMVSGFVLPGEEAPTAERGALPAPVSVATRTSTAAPVTLFFQAEGQAQPDRDTAIRAEAAGEVSEVLIAKGADVGKGDLIARLDTGQAEADLNRASRELERAQREFDNATALLERGVATADRVAQARATLAAAEAQVVETEEALRDARIVAPFAGRIENLSLDAGEFVSAGAEVGRIVDNRPLTVALQVPQQALNQVRNGQIAQIAFITGETREGTVSFVGTSASTDTRTFLAEIDVPNADGAIPAGISAEIRIPTGEANAHFISPSIVSLSPSGEIGVKVVEDGLVRFHTIEIARAEIDGIWVTGLPDTVELITVGQGFVRDGEAVRTRAEIATGGGAGDATTEATQ